MKVKHSKLKGCFIIQPSVFEDQRGYFFESFNQERFNAVTGKDVKFIQDNEAKSTRGVLRGLHFQNPPFAQAKLVRVIKGKVLDVAVDIRKDSPTYGMYQSVILSGNNKKQFFVPRGFAHGYVVLSDSAIFSYKVDNVYSPVHDNGITWKDETFNIDWKVEESEIILSKKDENLQCFEDFDSPF